METNIQTNPEKVPASTSTATTASDFWQSLEFNRFSITPMLLIAVACIGGFAAAVAIQESPFRLGVVAISIALVEAFILAVMPMRTIVIASAIALILCFLVVVF